VRGRKERTYKHLACPVLIALALVGCSRSGAEEFTPQEMSTGVLDIDTINSERTFTFSADPTVAVLQLHWSGGLRMDTVEYSLFGDGRLRRVRKSGTAFFEGKEVELSYGEAEALLRLVVDGGLMEWDWDGLRAEFISAAGREPAGTDLRTLQVQVVLETYSELPEKAPVEKQILTTTPALMRREAPEIREIAALDELSKQLEFYFRPPKEQP
jgi:hypothetical protein